jgi:hypothetical protein
MNTSTLTRARFAVSADVVLLILAPIHKSPTPRVDYADSTDAGEHTDSDRKPLTLAA